MLACTCPVYAGCNQTVGLSSCQVVELSDQWKQVPEVKGASVEWSELTTRSKGLSQKGAGLKKGGFIAPRP